MLVLSRKVNESIFIGQDVRISVLETREGRVRLGISAPQSISIAREELALKEPDSDPEASWEACQVFEFAGDELPMSGSRKTLRIGL